MTDDQTEKTIQFANDLRPVRSHGSKIYNNPLSGGIYPMRSRSSLRHRRSSLSGAEDAADEDPGLRDESDYKKRQIFSKKELLLLAYQSIGVIYGDIGTSPLYVFSGTFTEAPTKQNLVGALSLIIWSLFMMVTLKYIIIILHADNEGEGGTFSTYSLLSRFANISNRDPREASIIRMQRYNTGEMGSSGMAVRTTIEKSKIIRGTLKTIGVLAVSMVLSDGVLTPAQSVLGAVQGLNVVAPSISKGAVVGTTCGILILLFLIQPLGLHRLAYTFAPIVMIWLMFNAVFGIYNLANYDWTVLKAFNPGFAFEYLIRNKERGWRSLGGILLAFTGVEALFADLGAFSRHAIQLSWLCYCLPCLLLAYIGQASYISVFPEAYSNPFFNAAPPGCTIPALVIAILAAIVASQAIITATFQLVTQIMKLSYFPQIKVVHTSKKYHGQVYVPLVNWLLMIGTVLIAAIYNNTTSLGNAYGVCVMFVTFFDTCMVSLAAVLVWRISPYLVVLPWLTIACMDGTFLSSALTKVPDGAWFTLTLAVVLASVFILWRFGKESQWFAEAEDRFPTSHFVKTNEDGSLQLSSQYGGTKMSKIEGFGIFFDKAGETTPIIFSQFVRKLCTTPQVMVFFHLRPLETPTVPAERRYTVTRLQIPNCYRVVARHGYMDEVISPDLASLIFEQVRDHIIRRAIAQEPSVTVNFGVDPTGASGDVTPEERRVAEMKAAAIESSHANGKDPIDEDRKASLEAGIQESLDVLQRAYDHEVLYIIGKEQMKIRKETNIFRKALLETFLFLRDNTRTKIANLRVQMDRVLEIGFVKEI